MGAFLTAVGLGVAFAAPPGAVTTEAVRRGLAGGFRPAFLFQVGSLVGDAFWAALALTGLAFLTSSRPVQTSLGLLGALLLLWLAARALVDARRGTLPEPPGVDGRRTLAAGAGISLANPLAVAFWLAAGAALSAAGGERGGSMLALLFGGVMTGVLLWLVVLTVTVTAARRVFRPGALRVVNLVAGVGLAYFGCRLLWTTLGLWSG